ncbi:MAG: alpha-galactosidase [Kiritimatiellae bacterium]|nr:alpha-galactosidase [Kiritimatiellia bacterium]
MRAVFSSAFSVAVSLAAEAAIPGVSFRYGDVGSDAFAPDGAAQVVADDARMTKRVEKWTSPDRLLTVRVTRTDYKRFPVTEWLPELVANGAKPTAIVSDFRSADFTFPGAVSVRALTGTQCSPRDFTPVNKSVGAGKDASFSMAATEGRSSADWFPFWGVDFADGSGREFAIGWSGAWRADFTAAANGAVRMTAGMLKTHFRVLPGETLRLPSMLVFERAKGVDPVAMQTTIHRFMVDEKSPRDSKGRVIEPVQPITAGGGNKPPEKMKGMIDWAVREKVPFNCFWVDAGWNGPAHKPDLVSNCGDHWWKYVGWWEFNPAVHPKGNLREVSEHAHKHGMKMLLWVEPERYNVEHVKPKAFLEHRDWFLPAEGKGAPPGWGVNYLIDLGNPAACDFTIETISRLVRESKLDVYRQDFNFNVLPYWAGADAPDRVGVSEMKHVAGLYRFWDALRARFPDLLVENCASGGRRLDFEAISRSHSYCRSDYLIGFKGDVAQVTDAQNCTYNTLAYQPFQGGETRPAATFDDYGFFSTTCAGSVFTPSDWGGGLVARDFTAEETAWLREVFTAAERMRPFYLGDFHPLAGGPRPQNESCWCAWQMHRADLDAGFALVFRRIGVDARRFACALKGVDPAATYKVEFFREAPRTMKGSELAALALDLPQPRSFKLFFYGRVAE